ncbi:MAG: efflux transporter outer membrane subunit [Acidobacteria bacterium]|nr:efflux transporter outer membrane subunit [Acidobacteriota bacterium]
MKTVQLAALAGLVLLCACAVGPKYVRPDIEVPPDFRGEGVAAAPGALTAGDMDWWEVYREPVLQDLIRAALERNHDVRLAAERVLAAEAQLGITRADRFPGVGGVGEYQVGRTSREGYVTTPGYPYVQRNHTLALSAFFEVDLWGRLRRATEAARAELLATEAARRTVTLTLVGGVAAGYFGLRELDLELDIAERTLASRQKSLDLVRARQTGGVSSMLEVDQAQGLVSAAAAAIPDIKRRIAQQENCLSLLLGRNPGDIPRGRALTEHVLGAAVPAGLPSSLLERRPDIGQAEQQLIAANARIGVAKAAYFPQITLTGAAGTMSKDFNNLFSGPSWTWNFLPQVSVPIFTAGKIKSGVRVSESLQRQALIQYERTIQNAFREVADAMVAYRRQLEYVAELQQLTDTLDDQARLSRLRYTGGVTSYLEVLDSERQFFDAEINLARAQLAGLVALVDLYKALGGGWRKPPPAAQP